MLPKGSIEKLEKITRFDVTGFLSKYITFNDKYRQLIESYYKGDSRVSSREAFKFFDQLYTLNINLRDSIESHKTQMEGGLLWEIIDFLDDLNSSLRSVIKLGKWARSSITNSNYSSEVSLGYVLPQGWSLERFSRNTQKSNDPEVSWVEISLMNDLREEDYTVQGGVDLTLRGKNKRVIFIRSVIDYMIGDNILGKDLFKKLTYSDDDFLTLPPKETLKQSVSILASLFQGNNPRFPFHGLQRELVAGGNRSSVPYSILFRQIYSTFGNDDTFRSLIVKGIKITEDYLEIELEVKSRAGESVSETIIL